MRKIVVVAPHPDDETLGCGGTLLRHKKYNDEIHWVIVTGLTSQAGFSKAEISKEDKTQNTVSKLYGFDSVHNLRFPPAKLDIVPKGDIVSGIGQIFKRLNPDIVYLPYHGDVHTDHGTVADAVTSCSKWFRYSSIHSVRAYETLSETDFALSPATNAFRPNLFVNIHDHLEKKVKIMKAYSGEMGEFPFPRSEEAIRALAVLRGVESGCQAAEAFMLLKGIVK